MDALRGAAGLDPGGGRRSVLLCRRDANSRVSVQGIPSVRMWGLHGTFAWEYFLKALQAAKGLYHGVERTVLVLSCFIGKDSRTLDH